MDVLCVDSAILHVFSRYPSSRKSFWFAGCPTSREMAFAASLCSLMSPLDGLNGTFWMSDVDASAEIDALLRSAASPGELSSPAKLAALISACSGPLPYPGLTTRNRVVFFLGLPSNSVASGRNMRSESAVSAPIFPITSRLWLLSAKLRSPSTASRFTSRLLDHCAMSMSGMTCVPSTGGRYKPPPPPPPPPPSFASL